MAHYAELHPPYLPAAHEIPYLFLHLAELFEVGHFVGEHGVDAADGAGAPASGFAGRGGKDQYDEQDQDRQGDGQPTQEAAGERCEVESVHSVLLS